MNGQQTDWAAAKLLDNLMNLVAADKTVPDKDRLVGYRMLLHATWYLRKVSG